VHQVNWQTHEAERLIAESLALTRLAFARVRTAPLRACNREEKDAEMKQPGLNGRHRTLLGRISLKHGNTLVETLRKQHGADFLAQFKPSDDLRDVLHTLNEPSLSQLEKHYPG
jgi:hypothetical protein